MTNNNNTAKVSLTNAHGLFEVSPEDLNRAIIQHANTSLRWLRHHVAGCCGYAESDWDTALDDCSFIEVLIIWLESGNYTF